MILADIAILSEWQHWKKLGFPFASSYIWQRGSVLGVSCPPTYLRGKTKSGRAHLHIIFTDFFFFEVLFKHACHQKMSGIWIIL